MSSTVSFPYFIGIFFSVSTRICPSISMVVTAQTHDAFNVYVMTGSRKFNHVQENWSERVEQGYTSIC